MRLFDNISDTKTVSVQKMVTLGALFKAELAPYPEIPILNQLLKTEKRNISSLFIQESEDIHPGIIASDLIKTIKAQKRTPYTLSIDL